MSLNESIVEDAALAWFGELGHAIGHGPHIAPILTVTATATTTMMMMSMMTSARCEP